jgi:hypothetical protein
MTNQTINLHSTEVVAAELAKALRAQLPKDIGVEVSISFHRVPNRDALAEQARELAWTQHQHNNSQWYKNSVLDYENGRRGSAVVIFLEDEVDAEV